MQSLLALLRTLVRFTVSPILALILIFEEWGWEPLAHFFRLLARLPLWARLERWIAELPPYGALAAFLTPSLFLLPVKLLALYWISRGHTLLGLGVVIAAKIAGTAAVARLFQLTHPALMRLAWFSRLYWRWKPWKDALIARVKDSPLWRSTATVIHAVRNRIHAIRIWLTTLF